MQASIHARSTYGSCGLIVIKTVVLNIMTYFMLLNFFVISINVSDAGVCFAKMYCTAAIVKSAFFTMSIGDWTSAICDLYK